MRHAGCKSTRHVAPRTGRLLSKRATLVVAYTGRVHVVSAARHCVAFGFVPGRSREQSERPSRRVALSVVIGRYRAARSRWIGLVRVYCHERKSRVKFTSFVDTTCTSVRARLRERWTTSLSEKEGRASERASEEERKNES